MYRRGKYGQDLFTLRSSYFEGRPPKSVNLYWRRFALSSIPLDDQENFDKWLLNEWRKKDDLIEQYVSTGRFPAFEDSEDKRSTSNGVILSGDKGGFIETKMKLEHQWEIGQVFVVLAAFGLVTNFVWKSWNAVLNKTARRSVPRVFACR